MIIFYMVAISTMIVICGALSHIFLVSYLTNYNDNIDKKKIYWETIYMRCKNNNEYRLRKKEIRKLKKPYFIAAFCEIYSKIPQGELQQLILHNKEELIALGRNYKSKTMRAYYAYILGSFRMQDEAIYSEYDDLMLEFILDESVYCRENALKFFYKSGDANRVAEAYEILSRNDVYHSEKLLTDGLITFAGDFEQLCSLLMGEFESLAECYQVAFINSLAYKNVHAFDNKLIDCMNDTNSIDVKCSIIRLIGRIASEYNKKVLVSVFELYKEDENWEIASVAVSFLGKYTKDKSVEELLCQSIKSKSWYIRMNSAKSLIQMGVSDELIRGILAGNDEYAKNALEYILSQEKEMNLND